MTGMAPLSSIFVYGSTNLAGMSTLDQVISSQHEVDSQERRAFEASQAASRPSADEERYLQAANGGESPGASGMLDSVNRFTV